VRVTQLARKPLVSPDSSDETEHENKKDTPDEGATMKKLSASATATSSTGTAAKASGSSRAVPKKAGAKDVKLRVATAASTNAII